MSDGGGVVVSVEKKKKDKNFFKYIIPVIPPVSGDVVTATGTRGQAQRDWTHHQPSSARVEEAMCLSAFADCASCEDATHPTARSFVSVVVDIFI